MPDAGDKVRSYIRRELQKNPSAATRDLQEGAQRIDASVGKLDARQFHARYALPVKRSLAAKPSDKAAPGAGAKRGRRAAAAARSRESVQAIILQLVREAVDADVQQLIDLIANIDRYADRVTAAARKA